MKTITIPENKVIFKKGSASDCMYLIRKGKVKIVNDYGKPTSSELGVLDAGKFFGEMGVIDDVPRSADAVTVTDTELLEIGKEDFSNFVKSNPSDVLDMMKNLSNSLRKTNENFTDASKVVSAYVDLGFKNETSSSLQFESFSKKFKLGEHLKELFRDKSVDIPKTEFKAGEIIFNRGERGANMYLVLEGTVDFYIDYERDTKVKVGTAGAGMVFGEMGVIEEERRSATAVAATDVKLRSVMSSQLLLFLESNPDDAIKILRNLSARLRKTTAEYIDLLKAISVFVKEARKDNPTFSSWGEFCEYAESYTAYNNMTFYGSPYTSDYGMFF